MSSERLSALVDAAFKGSAPIDRLISRLKEEKELGYYVSYPTDDLFRVVIKWAEKCKRGED